MTDELYGKKLKAYAAETERALDGLLTGASDSKVLGAMRYSLLGGGKRIRAAMTLAACDMLGGDRPSALYAACAVEMLHCYSLIHDDLPCMDNDDMRRGKPSCHIAYGEANALLAGDALLTAAFAALGLIGDAAVGAKCVGILARAAGHEGMIYGQELDLRYEGEAVDARILKRTHLFKTVALIEASLLMGAACGNTDVQGEAALHDYAQHTGAAFQIVDDLLDVVSTNEALGKPTGSDERNEKTTYVTLYGIERTKKLALRLTKDAVDALYAQFGDNADFLITLANKLAVRAK